MNAATQRPSSQVSTEQALNEDIMSDSESTTTDQASHQLLCSRCHQDIKLEAAQRTVGQRGFCFCGNINAAVDVTLDGLRNCPLSKRFCMAKIKIPNTVIKCRKTATLTTVNIPQEGPTDFCRRHLAGIFLHQMCICGIFYTTSS